MPDVAQTDSLGLPVEIGRIDQELKKLWRESEGVATRASLMNLALYSEEPGSLARNTALLAKITENHACRGIVIEADCQSEENRVSAWISAHCHVNRVGNKQVCSEQLSFPFGFRSAFLSLVAGRISRAAGSAAVDLGRSPHLRQPSLERF